MIVIGINPAVGHKHCSVVVMSYTLRVLTPREKPKQQVQGRDKRYFSFLWTCLCLFVRLSCFVDTGLINLLDRFETLEHIIRQYHGPPDT
jgi:hypothetical protein